MSTGSAAHIGRRRDAEDRVPEPAGQRRPRDAGPRPHPRGRRRGRHVPDRVHRQRSWNTRRDPGQDLHAVLHDQVARLRAGPPTAKRLVEAHRGEIRIDCPPAGGTAVTVRLPILPACTRAITPRSFLGEFPHTAEKFPTKLLGLVQNQAQNCEFCPAPAVHPRCIRQSRRIANHAQSHDSRRR